MCVCVLLKYCVVRTGALKKGGMTKRERKMLKQMDFRIVFFELLLLLLFLEDKCNYVEVKHVFYLVF